MAEDGACAGPARPGAVILARHGEPALSRQVRLNAAGYRDWWARYEEGGLKPGQSAPAPLVDTASTAGTIFASTRLRSVQTARAVIGPRDFISDPMFAEAPLPPPPFPAWVRLSPRLWGFIARIGWWFFNHHEEQESRGEAEARADAAAARLIARAEPGDDVLVLAHGFFNTMVGRALVRRGWRLTRDEGYSYWSARRFEVPAKAAASIALPRQGSVG